MAETETPVTEVPVVDSPVVEVPAVETPAPAAEVTPITGNEELSVLRERLSRYEQLLVSPEYAEFLAAKSRAVQPAPAAAPAPKEWSAEDKAAFTEKVNNMSRVEFAKFISDLTVDTVREKLFNPIVQNIVSEKVQNQIAEASTEFPDFWDYKQDMIALSNANPALTAKQVYHLAKASRAPKPAPVGKPPVRKPSGEAPASAPASHREPPAGDFNSAFEQAFKKVGL